MNFVQPSEHQVLVFLIQLVVLLTAARVMGQVARRFGQPSVVGELAAGVMIGPSVLGKALPGLFDWMFPADAVQSGMLFTVGWLGVMLLLVVTGFETDLSLIARLGKAAVWVTIGSLLVPFAFGLGAGFIAPDILLGADTDRTIFALFLATALTISSLPVIAKILSELQLLRRNFGQLTLAVAMANDVIGWIILGVIAGMAGSGSLDLSQLGRTLLWLTLFLVASAVIGQRLVDGVLQTLRRLNTGIGGWVTVVVSFTLALGAITQALGVEAILGAFIGGILIGRSRYAKREVEEQIEVFTTSVVAPVFFATAGLRVDLGSLTEPEVSVWVFVIIFAASASKMIGSWVGARASGLASREGLALGAALNARGALEIVIATVGLSLGVLNEASYTIVVIMAIVTSVMASPLLRRIVRDWPGSPAEETRLKREAQLAKNVFLKPGRMLFPSAGGPASDYAARVLSAALPPETAVTIANLGVEDPVQLVGTVQQFEGRRVESTRIIQGDAVISVLRQAGMGYQMLASGTQATSTDELSDIIASMLTESPLPVVLVRPAESPRSQIRHLMLPMSSSLPARAATEFAIEAAARLGARLDLLHVLDVDDDSDEPDDQEADHDANGPFARVASLAGLARHGDDHLSHKLMGSVSSAAHASGVWPRRLHVAHRSRGIAIIETARRRQIDLVVVGVEAQDIAGAVYLGQTATHLLAASDIGLAIIAYGPR
jgi:Kef-type K+ transport system membrane component KefB/nucleotide-binding universal stress UspA family protein